MFHCCAVSASRSVEARLKTTEFSSEKPADFAEAILAGLRLVGTGLALWDRLQQPQAATAAAAKAAGGASASGGRTVAGPGVSQALKEGECAIVRQSESLLCERVCEAAQQRAQADAASKAELVEAGVPGALSAVLALRAGLTR